MMKINIFFFIIATDVLIYHALIEFKVVTFNQAINVFFTSYVSFKNAFTIKKKKMKPTPHSLGQVSKSQIDRYQWYISVF